MRDDRKYPSQLAERFQIRLPDGLRARIAVFAGDQGRSMNAEIVRVLEREFPGTPASSAPVSVESTPLRDHFAGQAAQASISGHFSHYGHESYWAPSGIASHAYEVADAMIAERDKGGAK